MEKKRGKGCIFREEKRGKKKGEGKGGKEEVEREAS